MRKPGWKAANIAFLFVAACVTPAQAEPETFRISLDTGPNHLRNITVSAFIKELRARTEGKLSVVLFHSGQVAKGRDTPKALYWGLIDMSVTAIPHLARYVPDANVYSLPVFYGLPVEVTRRAIAGPLGTEINLQLEDKLQVRVLRPYVELGYTVTFTTDQKVHNTADHSGLKLRSPGGAAAVARIRLLGASPIALPFGDVPLALSQGALDGINSTFETVRSGKLWDSGLSYAYADQGEVLFYVPMISKKFWDRSPQDVRDAIIEAWGAAAANVGAFSEQRQADARREFEAGGGQVVDADAAELTKSRDAMLPDLNRLAVELNIDPDLIALAMAAVEQGPMQ